MRELGIAPVFPPREDLPVGDIHRLPSTPEREAVQVLRQTAAETGRQQGAKPTREGVRGVGSFLGEYPSHVPLFLDQGAGAAPQEGIEAEMGQMLEERVDSRRLFGGSQA